MSSPFGFAKTQAELAGVLGISERSVREWQSAGLQCRTESGYCLKTALAWALENRWVAPARGDDADGSAMDKAELRCKEADAAIKEAKAEQLLSGLVNRESAESAISDLLNAVCDRLRAVPEEVSGAFPEKFRSDGVDDLRERIRLIVTEVSAWLAGQQWRPAPVGPAETESEVQTAEQA